MGDDQHWKDMRAFAESAMAEVKLTLLNWAVQHAPETRIGAINELGNEIAQTISACSNTAFRRGEQSMRDGDEHA